MAKGVRYSFIDLKWEKFLPVIMGILVLILIRAVLVWAGEVFGKYAASRVKETIVDNSEQVYSESEAIRDDLAKANEEALKWIPATPLSKNPVVGVDYI